jgi:hypothetical protein
LSLQDSGIGVIWVLLAGTVRQIFGRGGGQLIDLMAAHSDLIPATLQKMAFQRRNRLAG